MSTQELTTIVRDLKEFRLMAERFDAEISVREAAIKAHMEEHALDTLITTDVKITWKAITSTGIDTPFSKRNFPRSLPCTPGRPPAADSACNKKTECCCNS